MTLPGLHIITWIPKISYGCLSLLIRMTVSATAGILLLTCLLLIFPPGHQDRDLTIEQILSRDYQSICLSGGEEGESAGGAAGTAGHTIKPEREEPSENQEEENIEDLLAAAEDAERR